MKENSVKILMFEEDLSDVDRLQELLSEARNASFDLRSVPRLKDGLAYLEENSTDVILIDLSLPDSHGLTTFNKVNRAFPHIPIIVLTDNYDDELAVKAVKKGAQDYLVKGQVQGDGLLRAIRYAIERNRLLQQLNKVRKIERHLAYYDKLTNLPNRVLFNDRLKHAVAKAKRHGHKIAVLFLDLDRFKPINDLMGHDMGDKLLKAIAKRLTLCIRESDSVARLGGDEFTVILEEIIQMQDAAKVSQKVLDALAKPFIIENNELRISGSIGISIFPDDSDNGETLIKHADMAMYRAKREGQNIYQFYNSVIDTNAFERWELEISLRKAIENGELLLYYQPQVDLSTNQIAGVEALVRWQHPELGLLPPSKFMSLAEETGLIVPIGEWILRAACEQNKIWQEAGFPALRMSVNLSARQFRVIKLKDSVNKIVQETGIRPNNLVIEISEICAMHNIEYAIEALKMLRELDVQVALDDFGTGYTSLSYLKRLPLNILKIDKSFVKGLHTHHDDWAILSSIINMAHKLKLRVLAEGVENPEQVIYLRSLKCDEIQGFYFSRPIPAEEITQLLLLNTGIEEAPANGRMKLSWFDNLMGFKYFRAKN